MTKWPSPSQLDDFYGDPRGLNGGPSLAWETNNLVRLETPWELVTAWDGRRVKYFKMHKRCAHSLILIFDKIWKSADQDPTIIKEWGMHLFGGSYNFRTMRGSSKLSMHSWGCAVDFDPGRNQLGDTTPNFALIPQVTEAFDSEGWIWGGKWKRTDGMHWQAANTI